VPTWTIIVAGLVGGLASILVSRGRLPPEIGVYWRCWGFSARPRSAVAAIVEYGVVMFASGALAGYGAVAGSEAIGLPGFDAPGLGRGAAIVVSAAAAGAAGRGLLDVRVPGRRREGAAADPPMGRLAARAVKTLDKQVERGVPKLLEDLSPAALVAVARDVAKRVRRASPTDAATTRFQIESERHSLLVFQLNPAATGAFLEEVASLTQKANLDHDERERLITRCAKAIQDNQIAYSRSEWTALTAAAPGGA